MMGSLRNKTGLILFVFVLGFLYFYNQGEVTPSLVEAPQHQSQSHEPSAQGEQKSKKTVRPTASSSDSRLETVVPDFDFKKEVAHVMEVVGQLPEKKAEVLFLIAREDYFKAHQIEVKPHTVQALTQNQMGAVKVLALRELLKSSKDGKSLNKDLGYLIANAKDPTIVRVAEAAQKSLNQGRSFFDDFLDGILAMPSVDESEEESS